MLNSVRARLTLWYVLVFGSLLIGFMVFVYALLSRSLYDRLDYSLANNARAIVAEFQSEVREHQGDGRAGAIETLREVQLPAVYTAFFEGEQVLTSSYPAGQQPLLPGSVFPDTKSGNLSVPLFQTIDASGTDGTRIVGIPAPAGDKNYFVTVAEPLHNLVEQLEAMRRIFYIGFSVTLLIAGIGGFLLAKKSLSPVVEMSSQAKLISATNLQDRLRVGNPKDELGQLASVFNELLSRLEQSFEGMRAFMADASHELRTPLAIIRGEADVALSQDRDNGEYKEALATIQDEAERLSRIVDDMLALARADAGKHPLRIEEFYLNDLVEEACRAMQVLAIKKNISLSLDVAGDIAFRGDEDMIRRMMLNLLDNAIKYTPAGGSVLVRLATRAASATSGEREGVEIVVTDTGVGIPAEAAPHIFKRFYRVDKARSRVDGGSGLGLAIAKWVAEAHQGSISLVSRPGQGSTFTVSLKG